LTRWNGSCRSKRQEVLTWEDGNMEAVVVMLVLSAVAVGAVGLSKLGCLAILSLLPSFEAKAVTRGTDPPEMG
jgi:hypothetical protein